MKSKWIKVYEEFCKLNAREKCAVLEAAYIPIPKKLLRDIDFEVHFGRIKVRKVK